ncbi:hypothetical protein AVEN_165305-1 [Araneus ventricosus]|uniref:Uncharacterized protein n=1 Tax=Araneus ventricosus TaxID=182803 RepID=A0A4Y2ATM7_ARAVE|nr:hypothetical protein AVEN_165305-1 [Araneus ventricosus]
MSPKSHANITVLTKEARTCLLIRQLLIRELAVPPVYLRTDHVILNRGQKTRMAPELARSSPKFDSRSSGERLMSTDLSRTRLYKMIFGGAGSRPRGPPIPKPKFDHQTTARTEILPSDHS